MFRFFKTVLKFNFSLKNMPDIKKNCFWSQKFERGCFFFETVVKKCDRSCFKIDLSIATKLQFSLSKFKKKYDLTNFQSV